MYNVHTLQLHAPTSYYYYYYYYTIYIYNIQKILYTIPKAFIFFTVLFTPPCAMLLILLLYSHTIIVSETTQYNIQFSVVFVFYNIFVAVIVVVRRRRKRTIRSTVNTISTADT